jgi:hypothetical protein
VKVGQYLENRFKEEDGVKIVDADDLVTIRKQTIQGVRSYKTGTAG